MGSKKKRKESTGEEDATYDRPSKITTKTPKSSKKKRNESTVKEDDVTHNRPAKTTNMIPKSSKKKRKESTEEEDATHDRPANTPKSSNKECKEITSNADASFIASKTFDGVKSGYVFKTSNRGTGYYKDELPVLDKAWLASLKSGHGG